MSKASVTITIEVEGKVGRIVEAIEDFKVVIEDHFNHEVLLLGKPVIVVKNIYKERT